MRNYFLLVLSLMMIITLPSCITVQNLDNSIALNPGMSKPMVLQIMGKPIVSEFSKNVEEWHYCSTGMNADSYLALFFHDGKLIEKKAYTVSIGDIGGASGSCDKFIKRGTYREPDSVSEIRLNIN